MNDLIVNLLILSNELKSNRNISNMDKLSYVKRINTISVYNLNINISRLFRDETYKENNLNIDKVNKRKYVKVD